MDWDVKEAWVFVHLHRVAVGDEHPTRKGWFLKEEIGPRCEPLWYRPPSRLGIWLRRAALAVYVGLMAFAVIGTIAFDL